MDLIILVLVVAVVWFVVSIIADKLITDATAKWVVKAIAAVLLLLYVLRSVNIPNVLP